MTPTRLAMLVGGRSTEHDASLHGYRALRPALLRDPRFSLETVVYVGRDGSFRCFDGPTAPGSEAHFLQQEPVPFNTALDRLRRHDPFVVTLLHGNEGEDGCWQGLAEVLDIRGSFGPVLASALGMAKYFQSLVAVALEPKLRMPRSRLLRAPVTESDASAAAADLGVREIIVKPNRMGASLATYRLANFDVAALVDACAATSPYDDEILVQEFIVGRELTCGVVAVDGTAESLPVVEARTSDGFLSHENKHRRGGVQPVVHLVDNAETLNVKAISSRLFDGLRIFGLARFDYLVRDDELYFLEVNTLPGLMGGSAFPLMLQSAGRSIGDLVELLIRAERRVEPRLKVLTYDIDHGE